MKDREGETEGGREGRGKEGKKEKRRVEKGGREGWIKLGF